MTLEELEGNCAYHYTTGSHNIGKIKHLFIYMQKMKLHLNLIFYTKIHSK